MGRAERHPRDRRRAPEHPARPRPALSTPPRLPGTRPSPNIWHHPSTYELENLAADPHGRIEEAMLRIDGAARSGIVLGSSAGNPTADPPGWHGRAVLDLGCGTGFHLPRFARTAASVTGVEPNADLLAVARRRTRRLANVDLRHGTAQRVPLPDASMDVVHARWAYFFGPGCEPGLAELDRVLRRGGTAFVIDNDPTTSTFGRWFRRGYPEVDPDAVERFWAQQGWQREPIDMGWEFGERADLEAVIRIEFTPEVAEAFIAEHTGTAVDYAVNLWWRRY